MILPALPLLLGAGDAARNNDRRTAEQEALAPLQDLVGAWRGVGQPQRGSNRGAWIEQSAWIKQSDWTWRFADDGAALAFTAPESQTLASGALTPTRNEGEFALSAQTAEGQSVRYVGRQDEAGALVLLAQDGPDQTSARITIRLVANGKRLVVLHERRGVGAGRVVRLAETGYTRRGSGFGQGAAQVECIVTGGLGTTPVAYQGKTHYVCCPGCRDLFNDDPEGVLAEHRQRHAQEKADNAK